jgi:hypothetical protein
MDERDYQNIAETRGANSPDLGQESTMLPRGTLVVMLHPSDVPGYGGYRRGDMARFEESVAQTLIGKGLAIKYREGIKMPKSQVEVVRVGFGRRR